MKKILMLTLAVFCLTSCGGKKTDEVSSSSEKINIVVDPGTREEVQEIDEKDILIRYSTGSLPVILKREEHLLFEDTEKVVAQMNFNSKECGTEQEANHIQKLVDGLKDSLSIQYGFKYDGDTQAPDTFWVTLIPNEPGYKTMEAFKRDFDICNPNRGKFPFKMNEEWLMLVGSCGSGFDDDSGRPIGCQVIRDQVEPTLEFK